MKYDGVVIRFNNLYLFVYDPDKMEIRDGIVITEHECYKEMKDDQLMVVEVIFRDGTQELDQIDLDEFIYGDSYGIHDTFLEIYDLMLFSINDNKDKKRFVSLDEIAKKGELGSIAIECINKVKNNIEFDE